MNSNRKFVLSALAQGVHWLPTRHDHPLGLVSTEDHRKVYLSSYGMLWLGASQVRNDIKMGPMSEPVIHDCYIVGVFAPHEIAEDYGREFFLEFYDLTIDDLRKIGSDNTGNFDLLRSIMDPTNSLQAVEGPEKIQ